MAFNIRYTITNKILNNITLITSAGEFIEQSYLVPQWETKLRRQAMLHNTHSSTAIEGNRLTIEQVESLANGVDVIAIEKDKKEVLNYLEALENIPTITEKGKIKTADLLIMHKMVTKGTLENPDDCGVFRNRQVFVGRRIFNGTGFKEEVEYMPPETKDVPLLVEEFIQWLNQDSTWEINPVLLAGIIHYEIARIHPFIDGNGRTARLFATLIFYLSGFDHRRLFALDDFYDNDRKSYYAALKTVQTNEGDITQWLEYFTIGVVFSVNEVKEAILKLGIKMEGAGNQIALSERQMKIVGFINQNGKIMNRDIRKMLKLSDEGALREVRKLIELGVIKSKGRGRALHYILKIKVGD